MPASEDYTPLDTLKRYLSAPRRMVGEGLSSLATLPQRAFQASEQMRTEGPYNPEPIVEAAMLPMGTGAIAGAPVRAGETALGAGPIRAYHSSPHDFERFDLSKIGTGEGAQVYGHGLYFAENPAVSGQGGQYWRQFLNRFKDTPEGAAATRLQMANFDRETAARLTQEARDRYTSQPSKYLDPATVAQRQADLQRQHELLTSGQPVGPRTYEVNINADPAHMLDWDKPLAQQPRKALDVLGMKNPAEYDLADLRNMLRMETSAKDLREAGIPGIRYLDEGSRASARFEPDRLKKLISELEATVGPNDATLQSYKADLHRQMNPTSNYVVFNPSIIDIVKKYGLAGLAAPPAIAGAMNQERQQ